MAKIKNDNQDTQLSVESSDVVQAQPDMPVDAQEKAHIRALKEAHSALLPGRTDPLNKGLLGEFEVLLMQAEKEGNYIKAAAINNVMSSIGTFVNFVKQIDKVAMNDLKGLCLRVSELI